MQSVPLSQRTVQSHNKSDGKSERPISQQPRAGSSDALFRGVSIYGNERVPDNEISELIVQIGTRPPVAVRLEQGHRERLEGILKKYTNLNANNAMLMNSIGGHALEIFRAVEEYEIRRAVYCARAAYGVSNAALSQLREEYQRRVRENKSAAVSSAPAPALVQGGAVSQPLDDPLRDLRIANPVAFHIDARLREASLDGSDRPASASAPIPDRFKAVVSKFTNREPTAELWSRLEPHWDAIVESAKTFEASRTYRERWGQYYEILVKARTPQQSNTPGADRDHAFRESSPVNALVNSCLQGRQSMTAVVSAPTRAEKSRMSDAIRAFTNWPVSEALLHLLSPHREKILKAAKALGQTEAYKKRVGSAVVGELMSGGLASSRDL